MLICMFKSNFKESLGYDMIIPGSEIPKWFSHHIILSVINYVVFVLYEHHPLDQIDSANLGFVRITHQLVPLK